MAIVPSGKRRVMVAQQFSNTIMDNSGIPSIDNDPNRKNKVSPLDPVTQVGADTSDPEATDLGVKQEKKKDTISSYIFEKLQSFGYPPRRLQEFKSDFVKESVSPTGVKEIQIVVPDKKYPDPQTGQTDTIEEEDIKEISKEITSKFGLHFNGADRSQGKWTVKFTSENKAANEENKGVMDNLEQVYGKPTKGKAASSMKEMIYSEKNNIFEKLNKIVNGDK